MCTAIVAAAASVTNRHRHFTTSNFPINDISHRYSPERCKHQTEYIQMTKYIQHKNNGANKNKNEKEDHNRELTNNIAYTHSLSACCPVTVFISCQKDRENPNATMINE